MVEGKPFCGKCLTTHFVEQACKAEDLAKLVPMTATEVLRRQAAGPANPPFEGERRQGNPRSGPPGANRRKAEPGYPNVQTDGGEQPPKTTAKPKFDRAAHMKEWHARRKG